MACHHWRKQRLMGLIRSAHDATGLASPKVAVDIFCDAQCVKVDVPGAVPAFTAVSDVLASSEAHLSRPVIEHASSANMLTGFAGGMICLLRTQTARRPGVALRLYSKGRASTRLRCPSQYRTDPGPAHKVAVGYPFFATWASSFPVKRQRMRQILRFLRRPKIHSRRKPPKNPSDDAIRLRANTGSK